MARDDAAAIGAADHGACDRVARLLCIGVVEARVVVGMAGGRPVSARSLQAELDLSAGGAAALVERLVRERLVRREPDPGCPGAVRLRLTEGARLEVQAALAGSSTR